MELEVKNIEEIVDLIMKKMTESNVAVSYDSKNGVFDDVDVAIAEAKKAQTVLFSSRLELRERIIASIRETMRAHITELSELAVKETGMGRVKDKEQKNRVAIDRTPGLEDLTALVQPGAMFYGLQSDPKYIVFGGGMLLKINGKIVGAVGVSGGSAQEDMEIAKACVNAFETI